MKFWSFARRPEPSIQPIPQSIIDEALAEDFAAAKAEWLAEFRDDIAGWLPLEVIESAVDSSVTVRPPVVTYPSGVDPSGGAKDSFTAAVSHEENGLAVLDCIVERHASRGARSAVGG